MLGADFWGATAPHPRAAWPHRSLALASMGNVKVPGTSTSAGHLVQLGSRGQDDGVAGGHLPDRKVLQQFRHPRQVGRLWRIVWRVVR